MQSPEARSFGRLGVPAFAGTVSHVEKAHLLLSTLSFKAVPVGGKTLRGVHDVIARPSYRAVRGLGCAAAQRSPRSSRWEALLGTITNERDPPG